MHGVLSRFFVLRQRPSRLAVKTRILVLERDFVCEGFS